MTQGKLQLSDEEFWTDPLRTRDFVEDALFESGQDALIVDAPRTAPAGPGTTIPLVVVRVTSLARLHEVGFERHAIVVASDLGAGSVSASMAIQDTSGRSVPPPQESDSVPQPGRGGEAFVIDAKARLELHDRVTTYVMWLILRDELSGAVRIALRPSSGQYEDTEARAFLERERMSAPIRAPSPELRAAAGAPPVPTSIGIALAVPRVSVLGEAKSLPLQISYRVPVLPQNLVPADDGRTPWMSGRPAGSARPTAIVPITIVATSSREPAPYVWQLLIPHAAPLEASGSSAVAAGSVAVDLMQLGTLDDAEQTWFLYAIASDWVTGPAPAAFVGR